MIKKLIIILVVALGVMSCLKHKAQPIVDISEKEEFPCGDTVYFSSKIVDEIIEAKCSGCHTNGGTQGGVSLDNHAEIFSAADKVLATIKHEYKPMPDNQPKLNDSLIDHFECWIKQGKLKN